MFFAFRLSTVESDSGASVPGQEVFQDALSKKQRRPQEDERRRKDLGAPVSNRSFFRFIVNPFGLNHTEPVLRAVHAQRAPRSFAGALRAPAIVKKSTLEQKLFFSIVQSNKWRGRPFGVEPMELVA